ncbi:hypothetical protein [Streptococcus pyogenes]|uniref:hypothetical protein n=1 Tax=Streptococcus pyogenes TaxID=1314 RepID=UPI0010A1CEDB|nr:hypothetical protein [Streptococcus pyogenes]VGQ70276.1 phage protein [Streptococcus pyogenes]VHB91458.1 phage protein [Streptococcus pyogenes]VHC28492.1 phage protein [Streptococcus pyogenes]
MKKKLVLATLCLSMCAVSVRADGETTQNKFILDGPQQTVFKDDNGNPITIEGLYVGSTEVKVNIPIGWWVKLYKNIDPYSKNQGTLVEQNLPTSLTKDRPYMTDPYRQYYDNTPYTISLKDSPLKKGERLTFSFTGDDGFYAGSAFYRDSLSIKEDKEYDEEIKKIEEELEKRDQEDDALKSFKQQQQEEANKTWYQRVGDSFQDQWWNFKDWLRG